MSFLNTIQTVAKNYDEVYTKINSMISDNGIVDAADIIELDTVPFGAGMFLCILTFKQFTRWMKFTPYLGLKIISVTKAIMRREANTLLGALAVAPKKKYIAKRLITAAKMGLKMVSTRSLGLKRVALLGAKPKSPWKLANSKLIKPLGGLKIVSKTVKLNNATITWP